MNRAAKIVLIVVCVLVVAVFTALGGMLAFGTSGTPELLASLGAPFRKVDFSDLPQPQKIQTSHGSPIAFRVWPTNPSPDALRRAIADHPQHDERRVQVRQVRRKQSEGGERHAKDRHAGENHAARPEPVEPMAQRRRTCRHSQGGESEGRRYGLAAPSERTAQRFYEDAESEDQQGPEANHRPAVGRQDDQPSRVNALSFGHSHARLCVSRLCGALHPKAHVRRWHRSTDYRN